MDTSRTHTILVVDDDPDIRESVADVLAIEGYRVATAANGLEALEYLRREPLPCLVLLDLSMPVCDGWTFCAEQQKDARIASVPVAILSALAHSHADTLQHTVARLGKPVKMDVLLETLERHC